MNEPNNFVISRELLQRLLNMLSVATINGIPAGELVNLFDELRNLIPLGKDKK